MLTYLDALIAALSVRDAAEVDRLLAHPLARILPAEAREEAALFGAGACDPLAAPLRVMQLRHRTAELLQDEIVVAHRADAPDEERDVTRDAPRSPLTPPRLSRRSVRMQQMELPLSA
jgi:hypothetical protein